MKNAILTIIILFGLVAPIFAATDSINADVNISNGTWGRAYGTTNEYRAAVVDTNGCQWTNCYESEVAQGVFDNISSDLKFGSGTVGTTAIAVWDGNIAYNWIATAVTLEVSSSDVDDTVAGTGGQTIEIFGLDSNYNEISEQIGLNGQTSGVTTNYYLRIYRAKVLTAGSTGTNEGSIYIHKSATTTAGVPNDTTKLYAKITAGNGQTLMAVYTVPAGKKMLINLLHGSVGEGKQVFFQLVSRSYGGAFQVKCADWIYQNVVDIDLVYPLVFPEKTDVFVKGKAGTGTVEASAKWQYTLIDTE